MPILFKQHQRLPQRYTPDRPPIGQSRRLLNAPSTAFRRLSVRLTEGRQIRAGIRRHSIRAGRSARRSISRLRKHGSSIRKYFRDPKLLIQLAKYIYQRSHIKHLIPLLFVMLYMLFGAFIFNWIETNEEKTRILDKNSEYERERMLFVKRMEEIVLDLAARDPQKRRQYVEEAVDHLSWKLSYELAPKEAEWSLSTSMYFAGTIFTTIGYGDVACGTTLGKVVTVLYAVFGIPLMLITWNEMGKFLYKSINEFVAALTNKCKCKQFRANIKSKIFSKCFPCFCCKRGQKNGLDESTDSFDIEKGDRLFNGKLPNGYYRKRRRRGKMGQTEEEEAEEAAKAVSFKLSMQMFHQNIGKNVSSEDGTNSNNSEDSKEEKKNEKDEEEGEQSSEESETMYDNLSPKSMEKNADEKEEEEEEKEESEEEEESKSESEEESSSPSEEEEEEEEEKNYGGFETRYGLGGFMMHDENQPPDAPRMHVLVALGSTFAWVFLCAALFQFWEDWSYWESLYFMFISLLTIGLGDINVRRRDLMVLCFIFVIIGLSLVSMCIMVIQNSLEDLYRRILMKVLTDYQAKLKDGRRGSMGGALRTLHSSRTAKYLLPILSENTKRSVMQKVEEEARETGLEIPPTFKNFNAVNEIIEEKEPHVEIKIEEPEVEFIPPDPPIANGILKNKTTNQLPEFYISKSASFCGLITTDSQIQTETIRSCEKAEQTLQNKLKEFGIQTELRVMDLLKKKECMNQGEQTEREQFAFKKIQTMSPKKKDAKIMTMTCAGKDVENANTQTGRMDCEDVAVQTQTPFDLKDLFEKEVQTFRFMKSKRIQTPMPVLNDVQCQTIDTDLRGKLYPSVSMLRLFLNPIEIDPI